MSITYVNTSVNLKFKPNLRRRITASLLDYAIFLLPTYMYTMYFGTDNAEGGKTVSGLLAFPVFIFWIIYFVVVEAVYGATWAH